MFQRQLVKSKSVGFDALWVEALSVKNVTGAGSVEAIVLTFLTGDTSVKPLLDIPLMMLYS